MVELKKTEILSLSYWESCGATNKKKQIIEINNNNELLIGIKTNNEESFHVVFFLMFKWSIFKKLKIPYKTGPAIWRMEKEKDKNRCKKE